MTNVQSDDIQYVGLNNSCNYVSIDNLDTPSDLVRDSDIQSAFPNNSLLHIPIDNRDNSGETEINRNPPPLSNEAWTDIDNEFMNINKELWDRFKSSMEKPEKFIADLNLNLGNFLKTKPEFPHKSRKFFNHAPIKENKVEKMRKLKINLTKKAKVPTATKEDIIQANESVRLTKSL